MDKEYILCSAINYEGTPIVGFGCAEAAMTILAFNADPTPSEIMDNQGFITSTGRFVTREEAYPIAKESNQIKYKLINFELSESFKDVKPFLMSINLYAEIDKPEYILCAAINHKGTIINGYRHENCYNALRKLAPTLTDDELPNRDNQGFLTSNNRYVSRKEGWEIAKANNQIKYGLEASDHGESSILISENLY